MSVKFTIIVVLLLQVEIHSRELSSADRHQIALDCIAQTGIKRSVVEAAIAGNMPYDDDKYKEFLACSYKKQGYQNENGQIQIENVKNFLRKFYSQPDLKVLDVCAGYNETNHGQNAFNALQCILKHIKDLKVVVSQ